MTLWPELFPHESYQHLSVSKMILPVFLGLFCLILSTVAEGESNPQVSTERGGLIGRYGISRNGNRFESYLGIRFGDVPERFEPSVRSSRWGGYKDAGEIGPHCAQMTFTEALFTGVEDCLFLNVYTPKADERKRPVLVFMHEGGFNYGSTSLYGPELLIDEDVVIVTMSFRLGILGFLNTQDGTISGNNGLKDQVLGLKWVQENIEAFGGDSNRVTVGGNASGGASGLFLLISTMAEGLFHGVYAQAGSPLSPTFYTKNQQPTLKEVATKLRCDTHSTAELVECLRKTPLDRLIPAQVSTKKWAFDIFRFGPSLETSSEKYPAFLGESPEILMRQGNFSRVPVLLTDVQDEGTLLFSSVVSSSETILKELNENVPILDAIAFQFEKNPNFKNRWEEVSRKMRKFYFGKATAKIQKNDEQKLVDLFTDTWFYRGIQKTAKLVGAHTPTYLGHFTYRLEDDGSSAARYADPNLCEDLSYVLKTTGSVSLPSDVEFSRKCVSVFASFIRTGSPVVPFGDFSRWNPVLKADIDKDTLMFLNVGKDPYAYVRPYTKRLKFWEELEHPCGGHGEL